MILVAARQISSLSLPSLKKPSRGYVNSWQPTLHRPTTELPIVQSLASNSWRFGRQVSLGFGRVSAHRPNYSLKRTAATCCGILMFLAAAAAYLKR